MTKELTQEEKMYEVTTSELKEKIKQWRLDYVQENNTYLQGQSFLDPRVSAQFLTGVQHDIQVLFQWCEILVDKVEKLETPIEEVTE